MSKHASPENEHASSPVLLGARWQFGAFELNEKRLELRRDGELLKIEGKPLNLLMAFLRQPGELITKNDLINALWPNGIATDAMLGGAVAKLRAALGEEGAALIKNVFGFGYRFDAVPKLELDQTITAAPPKLDLKAGDAPPMRPNWRLVHRLGLSGDSWLVEHVKSRARRVFKFSNEAHGLSGLKREVTIYRLLRESLGDKACYVDLLDWNFDVAPWFIEAEYCPAGSLQEWFTAQGGIHKLPFATRLDLIIQIAEALASVHAVGVLHKDLKPANVFVVINDDGRPTIRLADFGSSGLHDTAFLQRLEISRSGFTQVLDPASGANSGTLRYLAPEVAAGQPATVKADIYALGLMLYQFVIGNISLQLSTGWEAEIEDEILREDVAAATEGNPDRRLADAAELARRLKNLDARRAVRVAERAAQEKAERVARQLERIRARRVGLLAAFAALAIGFVTSAWLYVDARKAREVAEMQARRAETEQRRAEKVADFLGKDMFRAVSTDEHPVKDLTVKELVDAAEEAVPERFKDEPRIAADVLESLGRAYLALEDHKSAARVLDLAMSLREQVGGLADSETLSVAEQLVGLTWPLGELPARLPHFEQILQVATERRGAKDPAVVRLSIAIARGKVQLGLWKEGQTALIEALLQVEASADYPPNYVNRIRQSLAVVSIYMRDFPRAEQVLLQALDGALKLRGSDHEDVADARMRLGHVYGETARFEQAHEQFRKARRIAMQWEREDGDTILTIRGYEAWAAIREGRPDDAIRELMEIKKITSKLDSGSFDQSFNENRPLALAKAMSGRKAEAIRTMTTALESARRTLDNPALKSSAHPLVATIEDELAILKSETSITYQALRK